MKLKIDSFYRGFVPTKGYCSAIKPNLRSLVEANERCSLDRNHTGLHASLTVVPEDSFVQYRVSAIWE